MENNNNEQKVAANLFLTETGKNALIHVLDVARRSGNRKEASLALSFIDTVEKSANVIAQREDVSEEVEEVKVEESTEKEVEKSNA